MISMTRREFDSVSAALTDAWLEARRRERLERLGLRPEKTKPEKTKTEKAKTKATAEARGADAATQH
jgi:hypothetical protein